MCNPWLFQGQNKDCSYPEMQIVHLKVEFSDGPQTHHSPAVAPLKRRKNAVAQQTTCLDQHVSGADLLLNNSRSFTFCFYEHPGKLWLKTSQGLLCRKID